jgi:hypothetical protein
MADFQYLSGSTWTDVPALAHPDDDTGSVRVVFPAATDRDGNGAPCGIIGLPEVEIIADVMRGTGWDFWQDFFADELVETADVSLKVFNERAGDWIAYAGDLLRPTCERIRPGATALATEYRGVVIRAINLVERSAPAIGSQPEDAYEMTGGTATFVVSAVGGTLTYQWQVDTGGGWANVSTGTGGTSASYTTATLVGSDNGNLYRCLVTNAYGTTTSDSATLTVTSTLASKFTAYWDFYEDATDAVGENDLTGTIEGYTGNKANFEASSSHSLTGTSAINSDEGGTIMGWVQLESLPSSGDYFYVMATTPEAGDSKAGFKIYIGSTGTITGKFTKDNSTDTADINLRGNPNVAEMFFCFQFDLAADEIRGWSSMNDDEVPEFNASTPEGLTFTPAGGDEAPIFGKNPASTTFYLDGTLRCVGWTNEILTEGEIETMYNAGTPLRHAEIES